MNDFIIDHTEDTPKISFRSEDSFYTIQGKSFPENPAEFYLPIYKNLEQHLSESSQLTMEANLEYINSSSVKMVFAFLNLVNIQFNKTKSEGYKIIWKYKSTDTIMKNK